jgi:hypothetical protein
LGKGNSHAVFWEIGSGKILVCYRRYINSSLAIATSRNKIGTRLSAVMDIMELLIPPDDQSNLNLRSKLSARCQCRGRDRNEECGPAVAV